MESRLLEIYDRASEWLKFAESKNAGLVALNAALVAGLLSTASAFEFMGSIKPYWMVINISLLLISATISMVSMVPQLAFLRLKVSESEQTKSVFFFEHIQKWYAEPVDYLNAIALAEGTDPKEWTALEIDFADQIIQISRIGTRKYSHFKFAAWITIFVMGTPILGISLLVFQGLRGKG